MNQVIYQLFTGRQENANIVDHSGAVLARMEEFPWINLKKAGFTYIYLLGLFDSRGPILVGEEEGVDITQRSDRVPSIFALSNHRAVNPALGSEKDLINLVKVIHNAGLKVLVDFVPNHTALNHPWLTGHPDYYQHEAGNPVREFSGDVAKLNYQNPQLCGEMVKILQWMVSLGVDGIRGDMVHLVPNFFWQEAIGEILAKQPNFDFFGEAYPNSLFDLTPLLNLLKAGFTALYHEPLYRNLKAGSWEAVEGHVNYFLNELNPKQFINYISNHDDPVPDNLPKSFDEVLAYVINLPGSVLIYNGLLNGFRRRLKHHVIEILPASQSELNQIPDTYLKLLRGRHEN